MKTQFPHILPTLLCSLTLGFAAPTLFAETAEKQSTSREAFSNIEEASQQSAKPALSPSVTHVSSASVSAQSSGQVSAQHHSSDYSIYTADVQLISDTDHDGYYSTFRVSFDADTHWSTANVYAEIYLTDSSGHRDLNFTTSNFNIHHNSINLPEHRSIPQ